MERAAKHRLLQPDQFTPDAPAAEVMPGIKRSLDQECKSLLAYPSSRSVLVIHVFLRTLAFRPGRERTLSSSLRSYRSFGRRRRDSASVESIDFPSLTQLPYSGNRCSSFPAPICPSISPPPSPPSSLPFSLDSGNTRHDTRKHFSRSHLILPSPRALSWYYEYSVVVWQPTPPPPSSPSLPPVPTHTYTGEPGASDHSKSARIR